MSGVSTVMTLASLSVCATEDDSVTVVGVPASEATPASAGDELATPAPAGGTERRVTRGPTALVFMDLAGAAEVKTAAEALGLAATGGRYTVAAACLAQLATGFHTAIRAGGDTKSHVPCHVAGGVGCPALQLARAVAGLPSSPLTWKAGEHGTTHDVDGVVRAAAAAAEAASHGSALKRRLKAVLLEVGARFGVAPSGSRAAGVKGTDRGAGGSGAGAGAGAGAGGGDGGAGPRARDGRLTGERGGARSASDGRPWHVGSKLLSRVAASSLATLAATGQYEAAEAAARAAVTLCRGGGGGGRGRDLGRALAQHAAALVGLDRHADALVAFAAADRALCELPRGEADDELSAMVAKGIKLCRNNAGIPSVVELKSGRYPSTPHLPFSPQVHSDDSVLAETRCSQFVGPRVVITEKMDGANCCIQHGTVYARTHGHPATHASFGPVKLLCQRLQAIAPDLSFDLDDLALFGENMFGVHSIEYDNLDSLFYLFGVRRHSDGKWLSWDEVVRIADELEVPTVPVLFDGVVESLAQVRRLMDGAAVEPSRAGRDTRPEGFVMRLATGFQDAAFTRHLAKYVRKGHLQTEDAWKRTWKKAVLHMADKS